MLRIVAAKRETAPAKLVQVAPRLGRLISRTLEKLDPPLSIRQFLVLQRIAEGTRRNVDLARVVPVSRPTMSGVIDRLVAMGMVDRELDAVDRRATALSLSASGRRVLRSHRRRLEDEVKRVLTDLTPRELAELSRGMAALERALDSRAARAAAGAVEADEPAEVGR
jgi:DNA-binding MarR family transcriptional regulator